MVKEIDASIAFHKHEIEKLEEVRERALSSSKDKYAVFALIRNKWEYRGMLTHVAAARAARETLEAQDIITLVFDLENRELVQ